MKKKFVAPKDIIKMAWKKVIEYIALMYFEQTEKKIKILYFYGQRGEHALNLSMYYKIFYFFQMYSFI